MRKKNKKKREKHREGEKTQKKKCRKRQRKKKEGKKKHRKKKKKKQKKNKNAPQKDLCRKKGFDTPNSLNLGRFSRRHVYPEEKENKKKKSFFADLALPTLFWQPCSANLALPSQLCQPCLANSDFPFYNVFSMFLKEAGCGIREVPSMSFYVFEGGRLGDKGELSMFFFVFLCFLFLCFFLFFFLCFFLCFCCLLKPNP